MSETEFTYDREDRRIKTQLFHELRETLITLRKMSKRRKRNSKGFKALSLLPIDQTAPPEERTAILARNLAIYDDILTGPLLKGEQIYPETDKSFYTDTPVPEQGGGIDEREETEGTSIIVRAIYTPIEEAVLLQKFNLDEDGYPTSYTAFLLYSPAVVEGLLNKT